MKNNLESQLDWFRNNPSAPFVGLEKVEEIQHLTFSDSTIFFDAVLGQNRANNITCIGTNGNFALENFRTSNSPLRIQANVVENGDCTSGRVESAQYCSLLPTNSLQEKLPTIQTKKLMDINLTG